MGWKSPSARRWARGSLQLASKSIDDLMVPEVTVVFLRAARSWIMAAPNGPTRDALVARMFRIADRLRQGRRIDLWWITHDLAPPKPIVRPRRAGKRGAP